MKQTIRIGNDPVLRKVAAVVEHAELAPQQMQATIDALFETMESADGLGLAAPQVGLSKRIVIVVQGKKAICLVNPEFTPIGTERELGEEGCLSFPGLFGKVARFKRITVKALGRTGEPLNFTAEDMDARVIQHEIDHLNGVLLPDRLKEKEEAPAARSDGRSL
ncbi:MAG: peptide deformylase [Candidatus Andersenbacteria bacterium]